MLGVITERAPRRRSSTVVAVRVVVVEVAAAGLGEPAADHVADGEQRDVEPGLVGEEDIAAAIGVTDQRGGDEHADDEEDDELGRLERGLRLSEAAPRALIVDLSGAAFMGVRGIAALVRAAGRAAANSTTVCVSAPIHLDLLRHLRAMGIAELFEVHTSVAGCRWALARPEPTRSPWTQSPPDPFDVGEF